MLLFARIAAAYALLVFGYFAYLYLVSPLDHIEAAGVFANGTPESAAFFRAGPGALFAGMAILGGYGLINPSRLFDSLAALALFNCVVFVARLVGLLVDGISSLQLLELAADGLSMGLFLAACVGMRPAKRKFMRAKAQ